MPISESDYSYDEATNDHYDLDHQHAAPTSTTQNRMMSKAELRKTHKPIMEKRRRAKINNCLNEIKDLILSAMKKDPERHSKLEKADILEMAVKHLKSVQKQQKEIAIRTDPTLALKYKSGYLECASEVSSYVDQIDGVDAGLKQRLSSHLNKCANTIERPQFDFTSSSLLASFAAHSRFNHNDDQNNNSGRQLPTMQGIELIPSCLPNGDFAFLVPKASFSSILNSSGNLNNLENIAKMNVLKELTEVKDPVRLLR
ncbi:protein deadpan [Atheta coriaria]|uniref:protein deadpan n=1 Tax=Dalotia coriaria TaxID=877792 RepID=UPI0031F3A108